ncbi:MAG: hypothetical protein AAGB31_13855, partial [Bdellovibrio sp.]
PTPGERGLIAMVSWERSLTGAITAEEALRLVRIALDDGRLLADETSEGLLTAVDLKDCGLVTNTVSDVHAFGYVDHSLHDLFNQIAYFFSRIPNFFPWTVQRNDWYSFGL